MSRSTSALLSRLKASLAEARGLGIPLFVVLERRPGESKKAWAARLQQAETTLAAARASGRRAGLMSIEADE